MGTGHSGRRCHILLFNPEIISSRQMNTKTINNNKILLVEDDPQDVKMMLLALTKSNLANHVKIVRDGTEALDYLHRRGKFQTRLGGNPDLVLLDNKTPNGSGLQVLNTI